MQLFKVSYKNICAQLEKYQIQTRSAVSLWKALGSHSWMHLHLWGCVDVEGHILTHLYFDVFPTQHIFLIRYQVKTLGQHTSRIYITQKSTKAFELFLCIFLHLCHSIFCLIISEQKFRCKSQGIRVEKELFRMQSSMQTKYGEV